MPVLADDDVIVHGDAERAGDIDDRLCHVYIRLRWRRIAGRVVVHDTTRAYLALISKKFRSYRKLAGDGDRGRSKMTVRDDPDRSRTAPSDNCSVQQITSQSPLYPQ
jgi:hypothetical protein